ncbi:deacetylase, histone deacetylase/acetoin utilization protein [Bernardetia litoralis DSM 6794]|uniref:Deacetylase, histone deacetylase/acetoin utilization protein n=1 Tax=Bernardetia litoralis (strain ATCC 23117 / DSM 6794 / NBRC 15988 / NCIMB 1366 / Fx l1 / Sio-4) TaxID=880071 RepID=I4AH33_BERLS|nr:histone deacetylase [Bernardetia litoralis]AFM03268.1 deacetylase, histone deacetylase/acetoin utilization protein [Bernardetia litoralis DSM 6794]
MSEQKLKEMLVFYDKKQCINENVGYSPSAKKPKLVVQTWKQLGCPITIKKIRALSVDEIAIAHDKNYVKGILNGKIKNGFGNKSLNVAKSLQWTTGSFLCASIHAYIHKINTFSPTSGFHHAGYNYANGFCTFCGLTIAAIILKKQYKAQHIGILDLDSHAGDGTMNTIHKTNSEDFITQYSLGDYDIKKHNNTEWLENLSNLIRQNFTNCDILFYQAGVDCHEDDPEVYSGHFTTEQIYLRDKIVYSTCNELKIPVVTNLAGGYQKPLQKIIDLHSLTAKAFQDSEM